MPTAATATAIDVGLTEAGNGAGFHLGRPIQWPQEPGPPLRFVSPNLFGGWMTVPMLLAPTPALLTGPFSSPGERKADESHVNTLFSAFTSRPSYMLSAKRLDPS
jgi:hypothetical protein